MYPFVEGACALQTPCSEHLWLLQTSVKTEHPGDILIFSTAPKKLTLLPFICISFKQPTSIIVYVNFNAVSRVIKDQGLRLF